MSGSVEFDEDKIGSVNRAYNASRNESGMTKWLIDHKLANSSSSAQGVMIAIIIINMVVAYILIKSFL